MTEILAYGYSSENTQRELSNEYQDDRVFQSQKHSLFLCALDESSHSIGRVNIAKRIVLYFPQQFLYFPVISSSMCFAQRE